MIIILSMIVGSGHKVRNLRLVGFSFLHYILLVDSKDRCTVDFVNKGGIGVLSVVKLVTFIGIVLLRLLQGKIRFMSSLHKPIHQRVLLLLLVLPLAKISCMPPARPLRHPPMSSLVCYNSFLMIFISCLI